MPRLNILENKFESTLPIDEIALEKTDFAALLMDVAIFSLTDAILFSIAPPTLLTIELTVDPV